VTYTPFDLPRTFTLGSGTVTLDYDGNQRRIRKSVTGGDETVYLGDLYERVTHPSGAAEHRYYVRSAERTVAIVTRAGGAQSTLYAHVDNLGSIDVLTDDGGAVKERRSYDPFGARRSPKWGTTASPPPPVTTTGFTGHEDDDDLGLVNMRGRVYDPRIGRFLTPDPIVSAPTLGQSWNPYSYVLNNPLAHVDPSGFQEAPMVPGQPTLYVCVGSRCDEPPPKQDQGTEDARGLAQLTGAARAPNDTGTNGSGSGYAQRPAAGGIDWGKAVKEGTLTGLWNAANMMTFGNLGVAVAIWDASKPTNSLASVPVRALKIVPVLGNAISIGEKLGKLYYGGTRMSTGEKVQAGVQIALEGIGLWLGARGMREDLGAGRPAPMNGALENGATVRYSATATAIGDDIDTLQNFARSRGVQGHDVIVHGVLENVEAYFTVNGMVTHPQQIADAVLGNPAYEGGPINLVTCFGACGLAQELRQILGVEVNARPNKVDLHELTGRLRDW